MKTSYQKTELFPVIWHLNVIPHEHIFINTWQKARKWLKLLGAIQTCFKFQIFFTDLIPGFNTSKFLKKPATIKKGKLQIKFIFSSHWKLSLRCFNMFIAFNSFVHTLLGIAFLCCKVFEIIKVGSSMYHRSWELSFQYAFYLVQDIRIAWLVYMYCLPIATLNQNKQPRLLYLGDVQITIL